MKIFYIEHHGDELVLTDFEHDYPFKYSSAGSVYFDANDYNYREYLHYVEGRDSIDDIIKDAERADFRIIDDPQNRVRERYMFGREIVRMRKAAGMSQAEVAEAAGLKLTSLISIELGRYAASFDNIAKIAKALGKEITIC